MVREILGQLKSRTILLIASSLKTREELAGIFQQYGCKSLMAGNDKEALDLIYHGIGVDVILKSVESPISSSFKFVRNAYLQFSDLPPIFFISNQLDPHFDNAFFEGVEAIFVEPIQPDELVEGVAFSLEALMNQRERKHRRQRIRNVKVSYNVGSSQNSGYATNISTGGMFVGSMLTLPNPGQLINFRLSSEGQNKIELSGFAIVRWLRQKMKHGRPRGFGIEFVGLDVDALRDSGIEIEASGLGVNRSGPRCSQ